VEGRHPREHAGHQSFKKHDEASARERGLITAPT
jgi:hypothetical protein